MRLFFFGILALQLYISFAYSAERVLLDVFLNGEERGEYFLQLTEDGDVLFPLQDFVSLGLENLPEKISLSEGPVSLRSLYPDIMYEINEADASLLINAAPALFKENVIDFSRKISPNVITSGIPSLVLNYAADYSSGNNFDFLSFNAPLEVVVRTEKLLFLSNFFYSKSKAVDRFSRLMSSVIIDDDDALTRYTFGDFSSSSGELGGSGNFGGISVSKNFSLNPYFIRTPDFSLSRFIQTTSELEVYVNDMLVKEEMVPPGKFSLINVPVTAGAGSTTIVIRDAFGREERITDPYYYSQLLLRPRLHEFSYNLGFEREDFGTENFAYGRLAFMGFHRYGFAQWFTGGYHAEVNEDTLNIGPEGTLVLGLGGELGFTGSFSAQRGRFGNALSLSYAYGSKGFAGRLSLTQMSKDYANLSVSASDEKLYLQGSAGVGFYEKFLGSLSLNASKTVMHSGEKLKQFFIIYSRKLSRNILLLFRFQRSEQNQIINDVFIGVNGFFGKSNIGSIEYETDGITSRVFTQFQKSAPSGTGFGYSIDINMLEKGEYEWQIDGVLSSLYKGRYGEYSGEYRRIGSEDLYNLSVSGSVACADKSLYLSRPITNSFAIVKVDGLKGVSVNHNNEKVAVTDRRGDAIIPNLIFNYENELSLASNDLPMNYNFTVTKKTVAPPLRGGSIVTFDVVKIQAFMGKLFFNVDGQKVPAEYAGLEIRMDGKTLESIIGIGGEFYLENIPPGKYKARVFSEERECEFELIIPESDETLVDLGEIVCEGNK
jgi:outer membrane usher protein